MAARYNIEYEWRDTDSDENLNELKKMLPNVTTIPQIWWNGTHVGGYVNFATEVENTLGGFGDSPF